MALSRRVKITLVGAGVAGVALVTAGGTAFAAGPGGGERTELQIVDRYDSSATGPAGSAAAPDKDCPDKARSAAAQAADTR